MLKKFLIIFLSLSIVFSFSSTFTSSSFAAAKYETGGSSQYKPVKISATKTVKTKPGSFPGDIALAFVGLGGVYGLLKIPTTLNKFLAWAGFSSAIVSQNDTTTYDVTMYTYFLKKPTSTSAGYYQYRVKNNKTGKVEYTKKFNIGKNAI